MLMDRLRYKMMKFSVLHNIISLAASGIHSEIRKVFEDNFFFLRFFDAYKSSHRNVDILYVDIPKNMLNGTVTFKLNI